jgi:cytochrome c553
MPETTFTAGNAISMAAVAVLLFTGLCARASEESVDEATKMALSLDPRPQHGKELFQDHCAACHGAGAQGNAAQGVPAIAAQRFVYLVRQLANFAGDERDSRAMHGSLADGPVRQPQAWVDLAGYLNKLPAVLAPEAGNGTDVAVGRRVFQEHCASCHYGDAHGDEDGWVPSLRHQHYGYLVDQIRKLRQSARHNVDRELVTFMGNFNDGEVCAVADYLSRLRVPTKNRRSMRLNGIVVD